jgi:cob(I)alamin adenosyltransferase
MAPRIYTRTGDGGKTRLAGGGRSSKSDLRVEAYGTVDELNATLGLAVAHEPPPPVAALLTRIQSLLFELGSDLATPLDVVERPAGVTEEDVEALEHEIDRAEERLSPLRSFILPAGTRAAAALHLARTVCRRAERRCVALCEIEPGTSKVNVKFINRLSDLLFVLARLVNLEAGAPDSSWQSR